MLSQMEVVKKTPKKRSTSVAATVKPFKRGKIKTLEEGKVRKITTFFEKKEASKFSKFYSGGEKVYEHNTANSNFKDGAKLENKTETGSEQLGSHSTNHYHTMGTAIQTDAPTSIGDYRVGPAIQTEKEGLSENKRKYEMWHGAEPKLL